MHDRLAKSITVCASLTAAALLLLSGCLTAGDYYRKQLNSGLSHERGKAVVSLGQTGDPDVVPALVDTLDDPDAGVRLLAIQALINLCGNDYGYRYYHDETRRAAAVERWRDAIRRNEVIVRSSEGRPIDSRASAASDEDRNPASP